MSRANGQPTRAEKSAANKAAYAVARQDLESAFDVDDELKELGLVTGRELKARRGDKSDRDCIACICELLACGVGAKRACLMIGVSHSTFYYWIEKNHERIVEKYEFAKRVRLGLMADEIIEIADDPQLVQEPGYDENGRPLGPAVYAKLKQAEIKINTRKWFLERLVKAYAEKQVNIQSIFAEVNIATLTPREAMQKYIAYLDNGG